KIIGNLLTAFCLQPTIKANLIQEPAPAGPTCRTAKPAKGSARSGVLESPRGGKKMLRSVIAETDEEAIIGLAAAGDRTAFGRLYERHALRVLRHAYFLTGDAALAEDVTAQVFLKALEAIPRYETRGVPFVAWLLRITGNIV